MQKIFIIFAILILSLNVSAQIKLRDLQSVEDEPTAGTEQTEEEKERDSNAPRANFVELNTLGVKKALVEKDYLAAIEFFSRAVEAEPACARCKFNLGRSYMALEKFDEAIRVFNELGAADADNWEINASLGEAFNQKKLYEESLGFFRRAIKLNPTDAITLSNYAISLSRLEKHTEALEALDQAVKLTPDFAEAHSNRGFALYRLGRYKEALEALKKAERFNSNLAQTQNNLGVVLDHFGKRKDARRAYLQAVKLKPDYGEAICNLAISYLQAGERDAAYQQLKALEKVDAELAALLRDVLWSKYVVDASKAQPQD